MIKEYVTFPQLYKAYKDCRRHKRNKVSAAEFEMNLHENLQSLYEDLNNGTYEIGTSIAFVVTKPKYREVFAADFRDRIVHHLLIRRLEPYFEDYFADNAYACRKGKGTLYGVKDIESKIREVSENYTKQVWILKLDIHSFFMSIDKKILTEKLVSFMKERCIDWEDLDWWINLAVQIIDNRPELNCCKHGDVTLWNYLPKNKSLFYSNGRGLPIGNLSSQFFANFYLTALDIFIKDTLHIVFGRYADDIIMVSESKEELLKAIPKIRAFLDSELHLELHPDKIYLQPSRHGVIAFGTIVTGYGKLLPGGRTIGNAHTVLKQEILKWSKVPLERVHKTIMRANSYFGYLINTSSYNQRLKLMKVIMESPFGPYLIDYQNKYIKLLPKYKNIRL